MSSGLSAWTAHLLVLKLILWLLGVPSAVPFLEALCYTGYPLVLVCINTAVVFLFGTQTLTISFLTGYPLVLVCITQMWSSCLVRKTDQSSLQEPCTALALPWKAALTLTLFMYRRVVLLCSLGLWLFVHGHLHSKNNEASALQRSTAV